MYIFLVFTVKVFWGLLSIPVRNKVGTQLGEDRNYENGSLRNDPKIRDLSTTIFITGTQRHLLQSGFHKTKLLSCWFKKKLHFLLFKKKSLWGLFKYLNCTLIQSTELFVCLTDLVHTTRRAWPARCSWCYGPEPWVCTFCPLSLWQRCGLMIQPWRRDGCLWSWRGWCVELLLSCWCLCSSRG